METITFQQWLDEQINSVSDDAELVIEAPSRDVLSEDVIGEISPYLRRFWIAIENFRKQIRATCESCHDMELGSIDTDSAKEHALDHIRHDQMVQSFWTQVRLDFKQPVANLALREGGTLVTVDEEGDFGILGALLAGSQGLVIRIR